MKRITSLLILCLLIPAMLFAGGSSEGTTPSASAQSGESSLKADIVFWSSYTESSNYGKVIKEAADAFMKENPGVKITISFQGTEIHTTIIPAMEAGTKITMFEGNTDGTMRYSQYMRDISEYYAREFPQTEGKTYEDSIINAYRELAYVQGEGSYLYFPYTPQFVAVWYNMDVFDACGITKNPTTWSELMDVCEILKSKGYTPFSSDPTHMHFSFGYYCQRRLGVDGAYNLAFATDASAWDDPAVLEIAKSFEEMGTKGYYADNITTVVAPEAQQEMVIDGKIAMYVGGCWMPNNLRESAGPDFRWGCFAYPTVENGVSGQEGLCYGCYGISINKNATPEEAEAAAAFAVFLTLGEWGNYLAKTCNAIPMTNGPDAEWPAMIASSQSIYDGVVVRYPSQSAFGLNSNIQPTVKDAFRKLVGGQINAQQFIDQIKTYY